MNIDTDKKQRILNASNDKSFSATLKSLKWAELGQLKIIVAVLATICLSFGLVCLESTIWKDTWQGKAASKVAGILLGSALVAWLSNYFIRKHFLDDLDSSIKAALSEHLTELRRMEEMGILSVYPTLPTDVVGDLFAKAKHIRVLQTWFGNFESVQHHIGSALANGARVEVLILSESSPVVNYRAQSRGMDPLSIVSLISATKSQIQRYSVHIALQEYECIPAIQLYIADNTAFVGIFWHGTASNASPNLAIRLDSAFGRMVEQEWQSKWTASTPCNGARE